MSQHFKSVALSILTLETGLKLDKEAGILFGAQVAMMGEAKGHGMELDEVTLDQIVALGNKVPSGVKARFGHPNECTPALGTFLGVRKNFRRDGRYVRADLHMSEAARKEYAEHVLAMAELHPEKIGNSVVVSGIREFRRDADGRRLRDEQGKELLPVLRVTDLHAVDVVDEPAAGDGMFAASVEGVQFHPRTIVEIRNALDKPGFLERLKAVVIGRARFEDDITNEAGQAASEAEAPMTLQELKERHPDLIQALAAEISAGHTDALAAAETKGAEKENERIRKFLSVCTPDNFQPEKDMPRGFAFHAIEKNLSYEVALEGLLERRAKLADLKALENASKEVEVPSTEPAENQLSAKEVVRRNLLSAVDDINKKGLSE